MAETILDEREAATLQAIPHVIQIILERHSRQRKRLLVTLQAVTRRGGGRPARANRLRDLNTSTFIVRRTRIARIVGNGNENDGAAGDDFINDASDDEVPLVLSDEEDDYNSEGDSSSEEDISDGAFDTDSE